MSPEKHYVAIAASMAHMEIRDQLLSTGFRPGADFFDLCNLRTPIDTKCLGVPVGKGTYRVSHNSSVDDWLRIMGFVNSIGRFCSINVSAQVSSNHSMNMITTASLISYGKRDLFLKNIDRHERVPGCNKVTIGNDVWIGANVFVNSSRCNSIGDGAIIGAGAIVLDDVPPYAVVFGQPARVRRYRFEPEQIETLLRVKWWEWDDEAIEENIELLVFPEKFFQKFS